MSKRSHLKVVDEDAKAEASKAPRKVTAKIAPTLEGGSARDVLASMRLALAKKLDAGEVSSNSIASAYKELRELDRLIRGMDDEQEQEAGKGASGGDRRSFDPKAL